MFTLICVWINGCVNNREAGDFRRYCAHYGVTVMYEQNPDKFVRHKAITWNNDMPLSTHVTYKSEQPTTGCIAIFQKYCCYIKHGGVITNLTLLKSLGVCYWCVKIPRCWCMELFWSVLVGSRQAAMSARIYGDLLIHSPKYNFCATRLKAFNNWSLISTA